MKCQLYEGDMRYNAQGSTWLNKPQNKLTKATYTSGILVEMYLVQLDDSHLRVYSLIVWLDSYFLSFHLNCWKCVQPFRGLEPGDMTNMNDNFQIWITDSQHILIFDIQNVFKIVYNILHQNITIKQLSSLQLKTHFRNMWWVNWIRFLLFLQIRVVYNSSVVSMLTKYKFWGVLYLNISMLLHTYFYSTMFQRNILYFYPSYNY